MKYYEIKNLSNGSRDYPLKDGSSIYLKARSRNAGVVRVDEDNMSEAIKLAGKKRLININEVVVP